MPRRLVTPLTMWWPTFCTFSLFTSWNHPNYTYSNSGGVWALHSCLSWVRQTKPAAEEKARPSAHHFPALINRKIRVDSLTSWYKITANKTRSCTDMVYTCIAHWESTWVVFFWFSNSWCDFPPAVLQLQTWMLALLWSHDIKNLEYEGTRAVISEFLSVIVFVTILWILVFKT